MSKTVKIPLVLANGEKVTDMKSLIDNFDISSVVGYFLDGKLVKWLNDRYYENEAEAVSQLDKDDLSLARKLCEIFGVIYEETDVIDAEELAHRNERIARLKQFTDDEEILNNVDSVAFDQEELAELYDKGIEHIILCDGEFRIHKSKQDIEYVLLGGATAIGLSEKTIALTHIIEHECSENVPSPQSHVVIEKVTTSENTKEKSFKQIFEEYDKACREAFQRIVVRGEFTPLRGQYKSPNEINED